MSKKLNNINDVCGVLTGLACNTLLQDELWQAFGYKNRPRYGNFFRRFINSEKLAIHDFIIKEAAALAFLDIMSGVYTNVESRNERILLMAGTSLNLCSVMDQVFKTEEYFEYLETSIQDYQPTDSDPHSIMVTRAGRYFDVNNAPGFLSGVVNLLISYTMASASGHKGFLLNPEWFKSFFAKDPPLYGQLTSSIGNQVALRHINFFSTIADSVHR